MFSSSCLQVLGLACLGFAGLGSSEPDPTAILPPASIQSSIPRLFRVVRSPEVHADGRATFRCHAPGARTVQLVLDDEPAAALQSTADGIWALTTGALEPGFYPYFFLVDGAPVEDPANELAKEVVVGGHESLLHVPGTESLAWETRHIRHGVLHRHESFSTAVGENRSFWVYTPPHYKARSRKRYPVLCLLHGVLETPEAWLSAGRAQVILDNLIERGLAEPMIVVFPLGYGFPQVPDRVGNLLLNAVDQLQVMEVFGRHLLDEVLPQVEQHYSVKRGAAWRAIAGVSMGGAQALQVGLNHPNRFAWIGSFSGATSLFARGIESFFPNLKEVELACLRLLWVSVGIRDSLLEGNRACIAWLREKGLRPTLVETPGGHQWTAWQRHLTAFLPLLFQPSQRSARSTHLAHPEGGVPPGISPQLFQEFP